MNEAAAMDASRWERVQAIFHHAADLPAESRAAYVDTACDGDADLRNLVFQMLTEDARTGSPLEAGATALASTLDVPELAGGTIGPYRLIRLLGEGGMGVVYLADRADLGNQVAIKLLRDSWLSPARRARFDLERELLARLIHPGIARLYDSGTLAGGTPWFAMEYVEGVPVTTFCREHTGPRRSLELLLAICDAVGYAHGLAVIHRDLKPSNVLVKEDGSVRLLDFGIAKRIEGPGDATRTGMRMMTPAYAAPEQIRGEACGTATDVYALGALIYEVLSGSPPFAESTRAGLDDDILHREPAKVSTRALRPESLSRAEWADLDVICAKALEKDPARRYPSVEAFARDVRHLLHGEPIEARPDSLRYRAGKFLRRNRRAAIATAAAITTLAAMALFFTVRLARARDAAETEAAKTRRIQQFMLGLFEGDRDAGPKEDLRVITLLDRGVLEARALDQEPAIQRELYLTLGRIYQKQGQFDRADQILALANSSTASGIEAAEARIATGLLRLDQARMDEAESLVAEGRDALARVLPPDHPSRTRADSALGYVLYEKGRYADAIALLSAAVQRLPQGLERADTLYELASAHFYAGNLDESRRLNQEALSVFERTRGEGHPTVSDTLINLGAIEFEKGNYGEAEKIYRRALGITEAWFGAEHYKVAANLTMLGRALVYQRNLAGARPVLERALAIQTKVFGPDHPRVASVLNDLGTLAVLEKRFPEAERRYREVARIYRAVHGEEHSLVATGDSNIATALSGQERYREAEALYRSAVQRYTRTLGADHLSTGIARVKLGHTLLKLGRPAAAEPELLAGREIVSAKAAPGVSWLRAAREDLIQIYDAAGRQADADRFREELARYNK